jgi:predicted small metal-binding protein
LRCPQPRTTGGVEVIARVIHCECGYVARGDTDDEVLADVEAHVRAEHPELVGKVSRQDELAWIQIEP